jgi:hypothetical protein
MKYLFMPLVIFWVTTALPALVVFVAWLLG